MDLHETGPWLLPQEPLAVRLMNTVWADRRGVYDAIESVVGLRDWFAVTEVLAEPRVTTAHLTAAHELRDALRRLAAHVTDDDRARAATGLTVVDAVERVNDSIALAPETVRLELSQGGLSRAVIRAADPVPAALAGVARSAVDLVSDPHRPLRACFAPGCVLYFVKDHARREWCSVACGNRARAARHYARTRS